MVRGEVADVDAAVIEIEAEAFGSPSRRARDGCGFGRVGEAVQLGELQGAVNVFDVAEDAAGADGGELLIITDQPDTRPTVDERTGRRCRGTGCRPSRLRR